MVEKDSDGKTRVPQRTCVGCGTRRSQGELVRFALLVRSDGQPAALEQSRTAEGRGAWICKESILVCFDRATDQKRWSRAFRHSVSNEAIQLLRAGLQS